MIGIERIDHINMRVTNLAESIRFYRNNFGFEIKEDRRDDDEGDLQQTKRVEPPNEALPAGNVISGSTRACIQPRESS